MKPVVTAVAGLGLVSSLAHAAETLDADAVRKLITGNTVHVTSISGDNLKNYFSPDGKIIRLVKGKTVEGTWHVNDDGTQCVEGMPGGCAKIVRNDDGSYDRVSGENRAKWVIVEGKSF